MRADDAADNVKRVLDVLRPDAKGFVRRILERLRSAVDRMDRRAQQPHDVNVERLPFDVDASPCKRRPEAELRADRRGCDAVLTRTGLGDESLSCPCAARAALGQPYC